MSQDRSFVDLLAPLVAQLLDHPAIASHPLVRSFREGVPAARPAPLTGTRLGRPIRWRRVPNYRPYSDYTSDRIYFVKPIGAAGPIKIGYTGSVRDRMATLAAGSPVSLELLVDLPGSHVDELALHEVFAFCRSHAEWFHPSPELVAFIAWCRDIAGKENVRGILTTEIARRHTAVVAGAGAGQG